MGCWWFNWYRTIGESRDGNVVMVVFESLVNNQEVRKQVMSYDIHDIGVTRL
jgi:hypothetical protein